VQARERRPAGVTELIGCVANTDEVASDGDDHLTGEELRGDTEDRVDELTLRDRIVLRDLADLSFSDCMHRLVGFNRSACAPRRSKAGSRRNPLFDESMVPLDNVI
jgi:hypothetical protein